MAQSAPAGGNGRRAERGEGTALQARRPQQRNARAGHDTPRAEQTSRRPRAYASGIARSERLPSAQPVPLLDVG